MSAGIDDASIGLLPKQPLLKVLLPWEGIFHVCIYFPGAFPAAESCWAVVERLVRCWQGAVRGHWAPKNRWDQC